MKFIVGFFSLVLVVNIVSAQSLESVMETYWSGASKARSEITESGYFYCTQYMYDVEYNSYDDTFEATMKTVFNLDGVDYISISKVKGFVNTEDYSVKITPLYDLRSDELPGGLYWISETIYLQFYNDADHEGYFFLHGQSAGMNYSDEIFELGNYPY